ncbi:hypothetical protein [Salinisphaera sp.]|uniref:hypothetical protein n=1 Tax=Salinisphaera sp. TaxID=1914330 RepID=UPI002D767FF8|nr:hypothetical protein [Salinisphaera sp.]HET7312997.1 hypothetical protein [Salinisphaera sp.]
MHVFPIRTLPWRAFAVAVGALCLAPIAVIVVVLALSDLLPGWFVIAVVAILLGFMLACQIALVALALYITTRNEITLRGGTMHLKGGEFHERVPLDSVMSVQRLDRGPPLTWRNGIALPGFRVGWYQRNDNDRFVFVIRAAHAPMLYVRTNMRFDVLLGVDDPAALGQRLLANRATDRD